MKRSVTMKPMLFPLALLTGAAFLTSCGQPNSSPPGLSRLTLTPLVVTQPVHRQPGMSEGQDLSRVAFRLQAPWMTGPVELRFPEVLRSSAGYHFLDNYSASITPTCEWETFPQWQSDPQSGRLSYDFQTPDGLRLIASATPLEDEVVLEFTVVNHTGGSIHGVEANCCLAFNDCPELNDRWNPAMIHAVLDGQFMSLDHATPTAAEMGRNPWFLILREEAVRTTALPPVSPTWWRIDQHHTENLMAATTRDGRHLIGYTWNVEPIGLMSNGGNPCLHTGMGESPEIPPGHSFTWHGKIYVLPNEPAELLKRHRADQLAWKQRGTRAEPQVAVSR